jgi:hypothetical protein
MGQGDETGDILRGKLCGGREGESPARLSLPGMLAAPAGGDDQGADVGLSPIFPDHFTAKLSVRTGDSGNPELGGYVHSVAFSPDGRFLAAGGTRRLVYLWDTSTWKQAQTFKELKEGKAGHHQAEGNQHKDVDHADLHGFPTS